MHFKAAWFAISAAIWSGAAAAGDFDGSEPMLCAVLMAVECQADGKCEPGPPESVNLPDFFRVDIPASRIQAVRPNGEKIDTAIERFHRAPGQLHLHGAEHQRAWVATIAEETGRITITAAGDRVGFSVFGTCTLGKF